jgi:hypothetical protein
MGGDFGEGDFIPSPLPSPIKGDGTMIIPTINPEESQKTIQIIKNLFSIISLDTAVES